MTVPVAVLLVAGIGSRLRPLTDDRPKALVDIGGETILHRAVRLLRDAGVRRFVFATGYRDDAVRAAIDPLGLDVTYCKNARYDTTQNAVSLHCCAEAIGGDDFVKLDGDVVFRAEVIDRLFTCDGDLAVAVDCRTGLGDEEMKVIASGEAITAFGKHLDPAFSAGESIGIERVSSRVSGALFDVIGAAIERGSVDLYYEDHYDALLATGLDARLVAVTDLPWTEVDTPEDLERARELVASGAV